MKTIIAPDLKYWSPNLFLLAWFFIGHLEGFNLSTLKLLVGYFSGFEANLRQSACESWIYTVQSISAVVPIQLPVQGILASLLMDVFNYDLYPYEYDRAKILLNQRARILKCTQAQEPFIHINFVWNL